MLMLRKIILKKLKKAERIAILGVGSDLRADDAAGELVLEKLKALPGVASAKPEVRLFFGETAPENLTGEIRKFNPSHIIIIDSADMGQKPGSVELIPLENIGGISFSTHRIPTKVMVDYLLNLLKCDVTMIGIQPKSVSFGEAVSEEVKHSADQIAALLNDILQEL